MASSVCVQNHNNLAHRTDDALLDNLAKAEIAYVPFHAAALPTLIRDPSRRSHPTCAPPAPPPHVRHLDASLRLENR